MNVFVIARPAVRDAASRLGRGYRVFWTTDPAGAAAQIEVDDIDVAVLDGTLAGASQQAATLQQLRARGIPSLVVAANDAAALRAIRQGAFDVIAPAKLRRAPLRRMLRLTVERNRMRPLGEKAIATRLADMQERQRQLRLLNQMGELLQCCMRRSDAYEVIAMAANMAFLEGPKDRMLNGGNLLAALPDGRLAPIASWGAVAAPLHSPVDPERCLGFSRAHPHVSWGRSACPHYRRAHDRPVSGLCLPLIAQGRAFGVLQLECSAYGNEAKRRLEAVASFATSFAEHVALSLANLSLQSKLRHLAVRDPLTGLLNRRYLNQILPREMRRTANGGEGLGLIMVDVDHFKQFNDRHGHMAGDRVLAAVGRFLLKHTRDADFACRYGGDEFLLILPGATPTAVRQRAEHLHRDFHLRRGPRGGAAPAADVTLSLGAAAAPGDGRTPTALLRAADRALYAAKRRGRDQAVAAASRAAA